MGKQLVRQKEGTGGAEREKEMLQTEHGFYTRRPVGLEQGGKGVRHKAGKKTDPRHLKDSTLQRKSPEKQMQASQASI